MNPSNRYRDQAVVARDGGGGRWNGWAVVKRCTTVRKHQCTCYRGVVWSLVSKVNTASYNQISNRVKSLKSSLQEKCVPKWDDGWKPNLLWRSLGIVHRYKTICTPETDAMFLSQLHSSKTGRKQTRANKQKEGQSPGVQKPKELSVTLSSAEAHTWKTDGCFRELPSSTGIMTTLLENNS